jgi:hypothetical protein
VGFVADKVALGKVFSEYFSFPWQYSFHRLHHAYPHLSSWADKIGQIVADVPSAFSLIVLVKYYKSEEVYLAVPRNWKNMAVEWESSCFVGSEDF